LTIRAGSILCRNIFHMSISPLSVEPTTLSRRPVRAAFSGNDEVHEAPYDIEPLAETAPLDVHDDRVRKEWLDWNGHMNLGYYVVAFDMATTTLCRQLGLAAEYTREKIGMYFVLECHVNYEKELKEGESFRIKTQMLDFDRKRLHLFHTMYDPDAGATVSTNELMIMNIDYASRRPAPWPAWAWDRLTLISSRHLALPRPRQAGSVIGIRR
jgi:acyl-CoA thioester hydrolase